MHRLDNVRKHYETTASAFKINKSATPIGKKPEQLPCAAVVQSCCGIIAGKLRAIHAGPASKSSNGAYCSFVDVHGSGDVPPPPHHAPAVHGTPVPLLLPAAQ